ncbi:MAG: ABC transporter ATP-binding protein [Bacteroidota bacterium]|nr:ABC transporter ATP-binding protein [Bacteroidota bacterium]
MLEIRSGKKVYNGREILNIPLLQLDKGIYWLQGINGSGKTTLLRMIAGLIPFGGDILLDGTSLQQQPLLYRRKISWAEAEPLYPDFITGREIISFYQHVRKAPALQAEKLIHLFGMKQHFSTPVGSYSSGMIKRLSLLLAFLGNPSLVLLDEPLATLDAEAVLLLPDLIAEYQQDFGTSFIFSSHQSFKTGSMFINKKLLAAGQTIHVTA